MCDSQLARITIAKQETVSNLEVALSKLWAFHLAGRTQKELESKEAKRMDKANAVELALAE